MPAYVALALGGSLWQCPLPRFSAVPRRFRCRSASVSPPFRVGSASAMALALRRTAAGRSYLAAREIAQGERVLRAAADVFAPVWPCALHGLSPAEQAVLAADGGPAPPARRCNRGRVAAERTHAIASLSRYWLLAVRAALLVARSPDALATLDDGKEARSEEARQVVRSLAERLRTALASAISIELRTSELEHVLGAILINCIGTRSTVGDLSGACEAEGVGLYITAAMFQHACCANCEIDCSQAPSEADGSIDVIAKNVRM